MGSFGRLWGKGHETLQRKILSVSGSGATTFLQGLVTSNLLVPPSNPKPLSTSEADPEDPKVEFNPNLRATCFLNNKGRLVTDSLLWKASEEEYFIDCPAATGSDLVKHLHAYKLRRSKVNIEERHDMQAHAVYGTLASGKPPPGFLSGLDPRHPSLGLRVLKLGETEQDFGKLMAKVFPESPGNYDLVRRLVGVAEGDEIVDRIALECNQEHLGAVSFDKGCYLGQELTARVHHTGVLRKRIMPLLLLNVNTEVPQAWSLASSLQEGRASQRFTKEELQSLPMRLPQLSVWTAGNFVAISTGSVTPPNEAVDEEAQKELGKIQVRADELLGDIESICTMGAKILDENQKTIGQILAPPIKGTNVVLALMRLDAVGLAAKSVWKKTNKITIQESEQQMRYLPYIPLWWPHLDPATGKARLDDDEVNEEEVRPEGMTSGFRLPKIEFETVPIDENENKDNK